MPPHGLTRLVEHPFAWALPAALAAGLLLLGMGNHVFWGDEAYTAILGRNILRSGYPTAWDGRNLLAYNAGAPLNKDLVEVQLPWVQYYAAAAGLAVFGENAVAGRLPFAAMGVATVVALYFLALRLGRSRAFAFGCATALAAWVPFLLFARQCRYYAPAMLAAVVMFHLWLDLSLKRRGRLVLFVAASVFFFHSQFLMFACFFAALVLADVILERRRERLVALLVSVPLIVAFTLPWVLAVGPPDDPQGRVLANAHPDNWFRLFLLHLRDYNRGGLFPVLMLVPLGLYVMHTMRRRKETARALAPGALVLLYTALIALTSPQFLGRARFAHIRYCVPAIPFLVLMLAQSIRWVGRRSLVAGVALAVLCFGTDLLTLDFLRPTYAREVKKRSPFDLPCRCLLADYVHENTHDYETPPEAVIRYLRGESRVDDTLVVYPRLDSDPVMFHLGDRLRLVSVLPPDDTRLLPHVRDRLPARIYTRVKPDWVAAFGLPALRRACADLEIQVDEEYKPVVLRSFCFDTTRPELFWRTFVPVRNPRPEEQIYILRRRETSPSVPGGK